MEQQRKKLSSYVDQNNEIWIKLEDAISILQGLIQEGQVAGKNTEQYQILFVFFAQTLEQLEEKLKAERAKRLMLQQDEFSRLWEKHKINKDSNIISSTEKK